MKNKDNKFLIYFKQEPFFCILIIGFILLLLYLAIAGLFLGYSEWEEYTGFSGKTFWNWLELLGVPLIIAFVGWRFSMEQKNRELLITSKERINALDLEKKKHLYSSMKFQYSVLRESIDTINSMLHDHDQVVDTTTDEFKRIFRAKVIATIIILDNKRNRIFIDFIQSISAAVDLSNSNFSYMGLSNCNISKFRFSNSTLRNITIRRTVIDNATFKGSTLQSIDFFEATGHIVDFSDATLIDVDFRDSILKDIDFSNSEFVRGSFTGAEIINGNFKGASFDSKSLLDDPKIKFRNTILPSGEIITNY